MNELDDIKKRLDAIKSLDLKVVDTDQIIQELVQFDKQIALTIELKKGTEICRTRVIQDVEKDIPTAVDQISYNPMPSRTYGRAHLVGETVFYGSLSTERMKHYFNTSFEVFDFNDKVLERQYFVTSKWILQEDITVIDVGNNLLNDRQRVEERRKFIDSISTLTNSFLESSKLFDAFIGTEFSKVVESRSDHLYKISASYCSLMFSQGFKGILYSSVGSNGAGLNIVLDRSLIDKGLLIPQMAMFGTIYNRYGDYVNDYSMKAIIKNNILRWEDTYDSLPPKMKLYYTGRSDDKSFQDKIPFEDLGNDTHI